MSNASGQFVWHDLMTSDTDAAAKFYAEVAGWATQAWSGETPYTLFTNNGAPLGGMTLITDEMRTNGVPPHWLPSVGVESVDESAAKAAELGGKIVAPPMDIPGAGRYAIIQDPQGASIAIFAGTGDMSGGPGWPPKVGEFSWHELVSTDHASGFEFYRTLFGWDKQDEFDMGAMGKYLMFGLDGNMYGGMMTKSPDMPMPPNWLCYIKVADAKASTETIKKAGGTVMNGPMEVPGGDWITQFSDPQGVMSAVHSAKSA